MGITVKKHVDPWMNVPVTSTNLGLFDVTPTRLETFKKQQENQAALSKELKVPKTRSETAAAPAKGNEATSGAASQKQWTKPQVQRKSRRQRKSAKNFQSKQRGAKTPEPAKKD